MSTGQTIPELKFLAGGGEMGARMRAFDWASTPLGPATEWPPHLRSTVSILLSSKAQIVLFWGPDLVTLYNDAYRPVFGAKHPGSLGLPVREAWHEVWDDTLKPLFDGVVGSGEAFRASDLPFVLERNGFPEEAFFDVSYDPVRNDAGDVDGVLCIVTETTGRVVGERRLRTLRELGFRTPVRASDAVQACAHAAEILAENPHDIAYSLVYLVEDDGKSAHLAGASGVERGSRVAPDRLDATVSEPWPFADVASLRTPTLVRGVRCTADGCPTTALVLPIASAGQEQLAGYLIAGVNPRRPLDEQYRAFLDLVANQLATTVANARAYEQERRRAEELAELDRAKTAFFSNVSHEFRTPLTLILGPLGELLAHGRAELGAEAMSQIELANRNSVRLLRLVNMLLDFSRIEAGRMQAVYRPTELSTFTADLASAFRAAVERAGLRFSVECAPIGEPVFVDHDMWEKVILNLLSNAFKFTFTGSITVALTREDGDAVLRVTDTGTGIPEHELPRLFERFHRVADARGRTHEGSGIGLAFVQELVRLHGGSVAAESEVGTGSTFTVRVPLGTTHLAPEHIGDANRPSGASTGAAMYVDEALRWLPGEPDAAPAPLADLDEIAAEVGRQRETDRPRVLVVDDNADMREYLTRLLSKRFAVETAADGASALAAVRANRPELVLTDVMMARVDGFGVVRELRANAETAHLPVIMLSARAGEEARVEGLRAGADDYLIKPFSARELIARVQSSIDLARARDGADLDARRRAAQTKALLDQAPLGVYMVDADFRIREVNPIARPVFGDIEGGVEGRDFSDIMHMLWGREEADEIVEIFRCTLATGEPFFTPERVRYRKDRGVTEYYEWRIDRIPQPDGRYGVVCYFRDISAHIHARKQLEASQEALSQADRRKDEFLATLAHELRNPLAPLRNMLELLKRSSHDPVLAERSREMMERQIGSLTRLVDDLLDVGRITRNKLELRREVTDLAVVLGQAVEACRSLADEMHHRVTMSLPSHPVWVDADPVRLAQIFANLLNNAYKYTPEHGEIRVTVTVHAGRVRVSVRDSGFGMPADMLPRVFDLFVQIDHTPVRAQGGLGIGLTLVKQLVEMHGGTVVARSDGPGTGSEFIVELPVCVAPAAAAATKAASDAEPLHRLRVLVVDDNVDSAESLALLLRAAGHETHAAHDGHAAVLAAAEIDPDVVLLDIGMPVLNGLDACRRIRALPRGDAMTLIALTGWGQEHDRTRSRDAGFNGHLVKPVAYGELTELLRAHIPARSGMSA